MIAVSVLAAGVAWVVIYLVAMPPAKDGSNRLGALLLSMASIVPLVTANFGARVFTRQTGRAMSGREVWIHGLIGVGLVVAAGAVFEAAMIRRLMGDPALPPVIDMVLQPWSSRYTMSGAFGLKFLPSVLLFATIALFVFAPARVRALILRQKARDRIDG